MGKHKIIVIGIDGGSFDVILPLVERGEIPTIASLMESGSWGELESTVPPDTAPAWVSMMTGVNPGKHGIFFFLDNLHNNTRNGRPLGSADIKFPPLWSILSKEKKKVIFINVPFTYPPMEVNGIVISGMFIPNSAKVVSYPPDIYTNLVNKLGEYKIDDWSPEVVGAERSNIHLHYDAIIEVLSRITEKRKQATLMLLEDNDWDFSMVVFTAIDRLQHLFWEFMEGNGNHALSSKYGKVICDGYKQIDNAIGEIVEKAGKDTTVVITSDHGFGPLKKHFFVNRWLEEIGLLKRKKNSGPRKITMTTPSIDKIATKIFPNIPLPEWTRKLHIPIPRIVARDRYEMIDWENTKAYIEQCGININLRGREPHGIVGPGKEFEEIVTFIQDQFSQLRDESEPSVPIADWIKRKEDIYHGPSVAEAVDLYFSVKNRTYLENARIDVKNKFGRPPIGSGMHRMNGIFIMSGPFCRKHDSISPRIIDITPTVLYLMGVPLVEGMDGRILEEIIDPVYLESHSMKRSRYSGDGKDGLHYSKEDEDKIIDSLKGLGYLS